MWMKFVFVQILLRNIEPKIKKKITNKIEFISQTRNGHGRISIFLCNQIKIGIQRKWNEICTIVHESSKINSKNISITNR